MVKVCKTENIPFWVLQQRVWTQANELFGTFVKLCNEQINQTLFSVCTGLPESWTRLTTESEFPISHGTALNVSCQEDYKNTGSDVITCNTYLYDDYSYRVEPQCVLGNAI